MHYDKSAWQMFYLKQLPLDQLDQMENHLASCDQCQESFLNCIDELEPAVYIASADFARHTMDFINTSQQNERKHPSARQKRRRMLINYVAAAAVTITLMSGGVFQSAVDQTAQIPRHPNSEAVQKNEQNLLFTWPEKIEVSTSQLINNMSFTKLKEVKW